MLVIGVISAILLAALGYFLSNNRQCPVIRQDDLQPNVTTCVEGANLGLIYVWGFAAFILAVTLIYYFMVRWKGK